MYPLKQSTAITVPFFVHDENGDGVTGLVDGGFTKRISKNGGAFAAMTVTVSEMENGWYSMPVSTAHSDTLGILSISLSHASAKRVNLQFRIHGSLPDDLDALIDTVDAVVDGIQADLSNGTDGLGAIKTAVDAIPTTAMRGTDNAATASALATAQADLDDIQARLPAALVSGRIDANIAAINDSVAAAARLALSAGTMVPGTVDSAGVTPSTTVFEADDITETTNDHYNGRQLIFTTGALAGQATSISDYTLNGGRGQFTVVALTEAPADNDEFIIV